jgi:two-component sensor histidine kinase
LILAELVVNAAKHAFFDSRGGQIRIDIYLREGQSFCVVADNGVGMRGPASGTGSQIVKSLLEALGARSAMQTGNSGTTVSMFFTA